MHGMEQTAPKRAQNHRPWYRKGIRILLFAIELSLVAVSFIYGIPALGDTRQGQQDQPGVHNQRIELAVVGDIMLSRHVGTLIERHGWRLPFQGIPPQLASADVAFANLECPASFLGTPYPGKPAEVTFRATPGALLGLKAAGFDVVSLANNHTNDYGPAALRETLEALEILGIKSCGAGLTAMAARSPAIITVHGIRLAFLAYADPIWSVVAAKDEPEARPGVATLDEAVIITDIQRVKKQADAVFVSLHWGDEYTAVPSEKNRQLAKRLIDAGAIAILGHHPHVLQGSEWYQGGLILYSMGNFIFDMKADNTYDSALALISLYIQPFRPPQQLSRQPVRIESCTFLPLKISRATGGPSRAEGKDAVRIQSLIVERNRLLGTKTQLQTETGVINLIKP